MPTTRTDCPRARAYVLSEGPDHYLYEGPSGRFIGVYTSVEQACEVARREVPETEVDAETVVPCDHCGIRRAGYRVSATEATPEHVRCWTCLASASEFASITPLETAETRYAVVAARQDRITRYLPDNYRVVDAYSDAGRDLTLISGQDHAGWTLDGYVIPRLASGLYFAREVRTRNPEIPGQTPADEAWWQS